MAGSSEDFHASRVRMLADAARTKVTELFSSMGRRACRLRAFEAGCRLKAGKSHSHLLARAMGAVNTGHLADDDPDDST